MISNILTIKDNIIQYESNVNKISAYLLALQSIEDDIDCKLKKSKNELIKFREIFNENINAFHRITQL